jgi:hypothetical protein
LLCKWKCIRTYFTVISRVQSESTAPTIALSLILQICCKSWAEMQIVPDTGDRIRQRIGTTQLAFFPVKPTAPWHCKFCSSKKFFVANLQTMSLKFNESCWSKLMLVSGNTGSLTTSICCRNIYLNLVKSYYEKFLLELRSPFALSLCWKPELPKSHQTTADSSDIRVSNRKISPKRIDMGSTLKMVSEVRWDKPSKTQILDEKKTHHCHMQTFEYFKNLPNKQFNKNWAWYLTDFRKNIAAVFSSMRPSFILLNSNTRSMLWMPIRQRKWFVTTIKSLCPDSHSLLYKCSTVKRTFWKISLNPINKTTKIKNVQQLAKTSNSIEHSEAIEDWTMTECGWKTG